MRLKRLMDELDKLRRYAGSDVPVLVRVLGDGNEEPEPVDVQAVIRERTDDGVRIVLEV